MKDISRSFLDGTSSLEAALTCMNNSGLRVALVVQPDKTLLGIVTDWDIRTALLEGKSLQTGIQQVMNRRPITGRLNQSQAEWKTTLLYNHIDCLPILDDNSRVQNLITTRDLIDIVHHPEIPSSPIMIMAGGQGKRLWPLTKDTPKPLLPIANKPLLEHTLNHVLMQGFREVWISTCYKSEQIESFVDECTPSGLNVKIVKETAPLGTAGSIKALSKDAISSNEPDFPFFIMNGDLLTSVNLSNMLHWHEANQNLLTVACRQYACDIPYGVLKTEGQNLVDFVEKPTEFYNINAGIYVANSSILRYIPEDVYIDMSDLIQTLMGAQCQVGVFPISEFWMDIGRRQDYVKANEELEACSLY